MKKNLVYAVLCCVCFNVASAYGAQSSYELNGMPIREFYNDFESYETYISDTSVAPDGYAYKDRVTNGYGGSSDIIYSANAADNIPTFNDNNIGYTLNLLKEENSDYVVFSGQADSEYIGDKVTLLITEKDFDYSAPSVSGIKHIKETYINSTGKYEFKVKWPGEYGELYDYNIKVFCGGVTELLDNTDDYIKPVVLFDSSVSQFTSHLLGNNVYTASAPDGNMLYGGLDGYYGWYGGGLFENYPDPYNTGFKVEAQTRASLGQGEKRLAVINEVKNDNTSNKLLIMDALYLGGSGSSGGGYSQTAVFGKHNLDFSHNTEIKFRLYPYNVGGSAQGFKMYLTRGEYNMTYTPAAVYNEDSGFSVEYHSPELYNGSYFSQSNKFELLRLSDSDLTNGDKLYMFKMAGAENRVTGYELVNKGNTPPTTKTKSDEASVVVNLPADLYYDITMRIDRFDGECRFFADVTDRFGELVFTTAFNGIGWNIPELETFLSNEDEQYGIVFEAHSSAWAGTSGRTKVGIDNLEFSKKDYVVRNGWLSSDGNKGTVNFDIYNYTMENTDATVYAAVFEKEKNNLVKILSKPIKFSEDTISNEDLYVDKIDLPADFDKEKYKVKLFVLSDNKSLKPLLKNVEIIELY